MIYLGVSIEKSHKTYYIKFFSSSKLKGSGCPKSAHRASLNYGKNIFIGLSATRKSQKVSGMALLKIFF